jgi:hypothetical protein
MHDTARNEPTLNRMPTYARNACRLRTKDVGRPLAEIGTYDHLDDQDLKSKDIIAIGADSYRVVFFVHAGQKRTARNWSGPQRRDQARCDAMEQPAVVICSGFSWC